MGLFGLRAAKSTRRHAKLWWQKFRAVGFAVIFTGLLAGGTTYAWMHGLFDDAFQRAGFAVRQASLNATTRAGFNLINVLVTGRDHIAAVDLLSSTGLKKGDALFAIDLDDVHARVTALPWVKTAFIARRWPDTVIVSIDERAPFALWQYQKKINVIDETGAVLPVDDLKAYQDLPLVVGADANTAAAGLMTVLAAQDGIRIGVESAVRVGQRRWDLHMKNKIIVQLPEKDTELALSTLADAAARHAIFEKNISRIDLRLPDRLVIDVKGGAVREDQKKKT